MHGRREEQEDERISLQSVEAMLRSAEREQYKQVDAPAEQIEADKALMGNLTNRELAAMVMAQLLCAYAC